MAPDAKWLLDFICSECHVAILELHPQESLRNKEFFKCPICGFSKQLPKEDKEIHKIIYGNKK